MSKLKPKWMKTDIPKRIKEILWRLMKDNPTFPSWQKAISKYGFEKEDDEYVRMSYDTYKALKSELVAMPTEEVDTLPEDLRTWINQFEERKRRNSSKVKVMGHLPVYTEELRSHDKKVFTRSDAIMNEKQIISFLWPLDGGPPIFYHDKAMKMAEFLDFFNYESNQYVNSELKQLCNNLCNALNELGNFLADEFRTPSNRADWSRLIPSELSNLYYLGDVDIEENPKYWDYFKRVVSLKESCEVALKRYRAYIRDIIFK